MENLKWYVLNWNFNEKKVENFNIFNSCNFTRGLENILKQNLSFEDFVDKLDSELKYSFWSKCEYEIMVGDLFQEPTEKVDIYSQVKPNIEILAKYILEENKK